MIFAPIHPSAWKARSPKVRFGVPHNAGPTGSRARFRRREDIETRTWSAEVLALRTRQDTNRPGVRICAFPTERCSCDCPKASGAGPLFRARRYEASRSSLKKFEVVHSRDTPTPQAGVSCNRREANGPPREGAGQLPALFLVRGQQPLSVETGEILPSRSNETRRVCSVVEERVP